MPLPRIGCDLHLWEIAWGRGQGVGRMGNAKWRSVRRTQVEVDGAACDGTSFAACVGLSSGVAPCLALPARAIIPRPGESTAPSRGRLVPRPAIAWQEASDGGPSPFRVLPRQART